MNNPTNPDADARKAEFDDRIERWRDRLSAATLTDAQAEAWECPECFRNWLISPDPAVSAVPIGFGPKGQVFVCSPCDRPRSITPGDRVRVTASDEYGTVADISGGWFVVNLDDHDGGLGFRSAELEISGAAEVDALTRQANSFAQRVNARIARVIAESGKPLDEIAAVTGIRLGRLEAYLDGRKPWTVCHVEILGIRLGIVGGGMALLLGDAFAAEVELALGAEEEQP